MSYARASAQEGPRLPDNSFYSESARAGWKRKPRKARKARKSGSGSRRKYARASAQSGPRLPGGGFYSPKARKSWSSGGRKKKASRKGRRGSARGRTVTSKSGRTYKRSASGRFVQVGRKKGKARKGGSRRGGYKNSGYSRSEIMAFEGRSR